MDTREFESELNEFKELFGMLGEDVACALDLVNSSPSPFADRTLVRTYFAMIEGLSHRMCNIAIKAETVYPGKFGQRELAILSGNERALNRWGEVTTNGKYANGPLPILLFSMNCFARVYSVSFVANIRSCGHPTPGFAALGRFVKLRNAVTHPKTPASFNILPGQRASGNIAATWFKGEMLRLTSLLGSAAPGVDEDLNRRRLSSTT